MTTWSSVATGNVMKTPLASRPAIILPRRPREDFFYSGSARGRLEMISKYRAPTRMGVQDLPTARHRWLLAHGLPVAAE
jgi:hypothetical protein